MRFHALDGLRGLCALTVALLHFYMHMQITPPAFIEHSFALVDFFFVLSGFVLAHAFFEPLTLRGGGRAFFLRRVGRLYPLHFFVLMLFVLVELGKLAASRHGAAMAAPAFSGNNSLAGLVGNLLLVQSLGLFDHVSWNFPAWSISVEFYVNLLFAGLLLLPLNDESAGQALRRRFMLALALAALGGIATGFAAAGGGPVTYDYGLVRCIYGFFLGVAAQRLRAEGFDPFRGATAAWMGAAELAVAATIALFLHYGAQFWLFMLSPPLFALAALIFAHERGPISTLLLTRPIRACGEWSYSIYLVHVFLLVNLLGRLASLAGKHGAFGLAPSSGADGGEYLRALFLQGPVSAEVMTLFYLALVLAASALTFRFIEKPGRDRFNALAAKASPRPAPPRRNDGRGHKGLAPKGAAF